MGAKQRRQLARARQEIQRLQLELGGVRMDADIWEGLARRYQKEGADATRVAIERAEEIIRLHGRIQAMSLP